MIGAVVVLVGILVALRSHYIHRAHHQPPTQTQPTTDSRGTLG